MKICCYSCHRKILLTLLWLLFLAGTSQGSALAAESLPLGWPQILKAAEGKTVYLHAWGGSPTVNEYIAAASRRLKEKYKVTLTHVKVSNIAESISLVQTEKLAHKEKGAIDILWINGENFYNLKSHQLLYGPFVQSLPNYNLVDAQNPAIAKDFGVDTAGYEAPWGSSSFVFIYNPTHLPKPPKSAAEFLAAAKANPGRLTYPAPPDFTGVTFLKQMLYELIDDPLALAKPVDMANYAIQTKKFWGWLESVTPYLWQEGRIYPPNPNAEKEQMAQGRIDINYSFAPVSTASDIARGDLSPEIRTYIPRAGTIQNTHYLAIAFNAPEKAAALVAINHLLSEDEQYEKLKPKNWGDLPVLDLKKVKDPKKFTTIDLGAATLPLTSLRPVLPEPHPSWVWQLNQDWQKHFQH